MPHDFGFQLRRIALAFGMMGICMAAGCGEGVPTGSIVRVDRDNFRTVVMRNPQPVLLEFSSFSCPPCHELEPRLVALAKKHDGQLTVAQVQVELSPDLAEEFGVTALPTVMLFQEGEVKRRYVGAPTDGQLTNLIAPFTRGPE